MSEVLIRRGTIEGNIKNSTSKGAFTTIIGAFQNSKAKKQAKKL